MRQYTRLFRIALSILGSFLLAFVVLGLVFTFRIKKSTVTAEAKSLVENLGTKSEIDVARAGSTAADRGANTGCSARTGRNTRFGTE